MARVLGYDTLCLRSEFVGLRVEDITPSQDGAAQVLVRRSKNDPFGVGRLAYVSPQTLRFVREWLAVGSDHRGADRSRGEAKVASGARRCTRTRPRAF